MFFHLRRRNTLSLTFFNSYGGIIDYGEERKPFCLIPGNLFEELSGVNANITGCIVT